MANIGIQKKTKITAIKYLLEVLSTLREPYECVNIKYNSVIDEYKTYKERDLWFYSQVIKPLTRLQIIECVDKNYVPLHVTRRYMVHIPILLMHMDELGIPQEEYKPGHDAMKITPELINQLDEYLIYGSLDDFPNSEKVIAEFDEMRVCRLLSLFKKKAKKGTTFGRTLIKPEYTDVEIYYAIWKTCPEWRYAYDGFQQLLRLNGVVERWSKTLPSIRRGKKGWVSKIGIRTTNQLCTLHTHEKHPEQPYELSREYQLKNIFEGDYDEYDVKGSIFRIERYLNTGHFLPMDADPYLAMFSNCPIDEYDFGDYNRAMQKDQALRLNFEGSFTTAYMHYKNRLYYSLRSSYRDLQQADIRAMAESQAEERKELLRWMYDTVKEFTGMGNMNTSVFLHESCIMQDVRIELAKRGIRTALVYDCLYTRKGEMPDDIKNIIKKAIRAYRKKFTL